MSDQPQPSTQVKVFNHSRKGPIVGVEVGGDETWVNIQVLGDFVPVMFAADNQGTVYADGEVVTVRRSLITSISDWEG